MKNTHGNFNTLHKNCVCEIGFFDNGVFAIKNVKRIKTFSTSTNAVMVYNRLQQIKKGGF